jgi:hypothetical protein
MDFGVFYTCYTEKKAVEYSLEVLFSIYPDVPVYLISDGGSDYSDSEKRFRNTGNNLKCFLENDSRGQIPSFAHRSDFYTEEVQKLVFSSVKTFLDRTKRAIEFCNKEYLLVMEPDVLVRGKISNADKHKLLGSRINVGMSNEIRQVVNSFPGSIDVNNWGATPAIFECKSFLLIHDLISNNDELLKQLCISDRRFANYDFMFAVLFALIGIPETFNSEIIECFRDSNWQIKNNPLVHQFRAKYPLSSDGYNGTHIINKDGIGDNWFWNR